MRLEEVAKKANVSTATVSRVVNKLDNVNSKTRKRVLAALEELQYTPNLQARALSSGQSKTIGIIVSNLENPFYVDVFSLLEKRAHLGGYEILLANTNYDPAYMAQALKQMLGRRVSGLAIAISESLPEEISGVLAAGIPVVCFETGEGHKNIPQIHWDVQGGMRKLVEYLHALGHRRMAYVGTRIPLTTAEVRRTTFIETAERLKMQHTEIALGPHSHGSDAGRRAVHRLIEEGCNASAILCINDATAFGVLRELYSRNIAVPNDVSVTGFDNIALSECFCPSLTTVSISRETATKMMFEILTTPSVVKAPVNFRIGADVIIRESTGPYLGGGLLTPGKRSK